MIYQYVLDNPLTSSDLNELRIIMKEDWPQKIRNRSHAVILLFKDHRSFEDVANIFGVHLTTIHNWAGRWAVEGINGVFDLDGRGAKPAFTEAEELIVIECLETDPRSLRKLDAMVMERTGKTAGTSTYTKIIKKHGKSWKRQRKTPKGKPTEEQYRQGLEDLAELKKLAQDGEFELVYFDASGFSLQPCIPYAWQDIGRAGTLRIPASHSPRINILGFLNPTTSDLVTYQPTGSMTSAVIIEIMDDYCEIITKQTVAVLDNAPIHVSQAVRKCIPRWEEKGLTLYLIPPYSPELNLIEILWRKIKYEWIASYAYTSMTALTTELSRILNGYGSEYRIEFSNK